MYIPLLFFIESMGRLIVRMFSAIAEFDREIIVERLVESKTIARQNPH